MKALAASALTALVLVTAAWASNVTPAQLNALSKRVTRLERQNTALAQIIAAVSCTTFKPVVIYDVTVHHSDGSADTKFPTWAPPDPGAAPDFWVPTSSASACPAPK